MTLSKETIQERYGNLKLDEAIKAMIDDMCDTELIMSWVVRYGKAAYESGYNRGVAHTTSRARNRPGDGDMGG